MGVAEEYRKKCAAHGWAFFDAEGVAEFNTVDYMHLSRRGIASSPMRSRRECAI